MRFCTCFWKLLPRFSHASAGLTPGVTLWFIEFRHWLRYRQLTVSVQQVLPKEHGGTNTDISGVSKQKIWQKTNLFQPNFNHLVVFFFQLS